MLPVAFLSARNKEGFVSVTPKCDGESLRTDLATSGAFDTTDPQSPPRFLLRLLLRSRHIKVFVISNAIVVRRG